MMSHSLLNLTELLLPPGEEWTAEEEAWHFLHLTLGEGYWLEEKQAWDFHQNETLVVLRGRQGRLRASQLGPVRLHLFHFRPDLLVELLTPAERQFLQQKAQRSTRGAIRLAADHPASAVLHGLCSQPTPRSGLELRARLLLVVALAFRWKPVPGRTLKGGALAAEARLRALMSQLTELELGALSPATLAGRCACSVLHFKRLFRRTYGISFRAHQNTLRLLRARQMLAETNLSVSAVLQTVGCRDLRHFRRLFRKAWGMSPQDFRTAHRAAGRQPIPDRGRQPDRRSDIVLS